MSKMLRYLLEAEEPLFTQSLRELEFLTGKKAVDVKLTADVIERTHLAVRGLGLDSNDSTDKELYFALKQRVHEHNAHLMTAFGIAVNASSEDIARNLIQVFKKKAKPSKLWVLKKSVAKNLIREMPPKTLMKKLRYRSVESMLKKEKLEELYVAMRYSEGDEWLGAFNGLFESRVVPSDFENRELALVVLSSDRWSGVVKYDDRRRRSVVHAKEMGIIAVPPLELRDTKGMVVRVLPLLFHYFNEVRLYSAFFKFRSTEANFGQIITDTLTSESEVGASIANFHIHWRIIQRYFGENGESPEFFQPHIQPEDLSWRKAEKSMFGISSELRFWQDLDYVAVHGVDGRPISFNLADAALNYSYDISFANRSVHFFRESLWNEIFLRYVGEENVRKILLSQLDKNSVVKPEELE